MCYSALAITHVGSNVGLPRGEVNHHDRWEPSSALLMSVTLPTCNCRTCRRSWPQVLGSFFMKAQVISPLLLPVLSLLSLLANYTT